MNPIENALSEAAVVIAEYHTHLATATRSAIESGDNAVARNLLARSKRAYRAMGIVAAALETLDAQREATYEAAAPCSE